MVKYRKYTPKQTYKYYDFRYLRSFNMPFTLVLSGRGYGKTHGMMRIFVKEFLTKGRKFMVIRDTESALDELLANKGEKLLGKIFRLHFPEDEYELENGVIYINGETAGYCISVSTYYKRKGNDYSDIVNILYDEFIPEEIQPKKVPVRAIINTFETVIRNRTDAKVYLMANAIDRGDETLELLGVQNIKDFGIYTNFEKGVVLHYAEASEGYIIDRQASIMGNLLKDTRFDDNLTHGQFEDHNIVYKKQPPRATFYYAIHLFDGSFRLYRDSEGHYYITNDSGKGYIGKRYTFSPELVNTIIKPFPQPQETFKLLEDLFKLRKISFETKYVLNLFTELLVKKGRP